MKMEADYNKPYIMQLHNIYARSAKETCPSRAFSYTLCIIIVILAGGGCDEPTPIAITPEETANIVLRDYLLAADETWDAEKTYTVHGELEIPPDITLRIPPETTVRFGRDALVKVRGILKIGVDAEQAGAVKPVKLTSDIPGPQRGDWNGILFDHTHGLDSFIRGAHIEYATVALDIKTTSPTIADCTFRLNDIAIALDGSDAVIQHNELVDNNIGIRTIGRQTRPKIERNSITRNEIGIHCENVQSIIHYNNLSGNIRALKLGVKFDLYAPENWWGTLNVESIDTAIVDAADPELLHKQVGTVTYEPIADAPIADAGPRR